jgi:hypothetical protein
MGLTMTLPDFLKYAFLFAGIALFLVAGIGVFWEQRAALASIPAILLVMSANLDRIESFKASFPSSTIEAKTRELTQTVDEAKNIIEQLRSLAVITAESLIDLRVNSNALLSSSGDEFGEQDAFKAKVLKALKGMGLPQDKLKEVANSDRSVILKFYAYASYRFGRNTLQQSRWQEFDNAYQSVTNAQSTKSLSPDQCQELLDEFHIDTAKFAEYMEDFRYYVRTGEQRRPKVWAERGNWGFGELP